MYKIYNVWADIAKEFYFNEYPQIDFGEINNYVFAGMGGSGTIGDIFAAIFSKTHIPVTVVKGYNLPKTVNENSLVIIISVSGNTLETLNILKQVKNQGLKSISFSDGGKIEDFCKINQLNYIKIKKIHSPRASLTAYLYALLKILKKNIPLTENEILESIDKIEQVASNIYTRNLSKINIAIKLSDEISNEPIIYYPWGLQSVAIRFKNSLQENSKIHAMAEDIIEASHNGIVPWDSNTKFIPILIQGEDDFIKTRERWIIIKKFFDLNKIKYLEIKSCKGNILTKIIYLIYILDFTSIYLSIRNGIDPSPVEPINYIKNQLTD